MTERLERAVHEAGHAVAALALGIGVALVSIRGDRDDNGHVDITDTGTLEIRAMVRLAGREALVLDGLPVRGCGRDDAEARAYALEFAGGDAGEADRLLAEWRRRARELLFDRDRRREHGAVTLALVERETLTADELGSVLYWTRSRARAA